MKNLIIELEKEIVNINEKVTFKNIRLNTHVYTTKNNYYEDLMNFSNAFNKLFNNFNDSNILNCYIINNEKFFLEALYYLNTDSLISTEGIEKFNEATFNTSYAKCSKDYNYYIMKWIDSMAFIILIATRKPMN